MSSLPNGGGGGVALTPEKVRTFRRLRWGHFAAFVVMAVQTAVVAALPLGVEMPQITSFPLLYRGANDTNTILTTPQQQMFKTPFNVQAAVAVFLGLAALDHLVVWLIAVCRPSIIQRWWFRYKINPVRWLEYSASASLMLVLIAVLCGVYDMHLLFTLGSLCALCMFCGLLLDFIPRNIDLELSSSIATRGVGRALRRVGVGIYVLGCLAILLPLAVVFCYFFRGVKQFGSSSIPLFVYFAFFGTVFNFLSFGFVMGAYFVWRKFRFVTTEWLYILLSFTAKSYLAWSVWIGFRQRSLA